MEDSDNQRKVLDALETELRKDRSPTRIMPGSSSTLVIVTRKRTRLSLEKTMCQPCPYCGGNGMIKSVATICYEILNEIKKQALFLEGHEVILRVNPDVATALKDGEAEVFTRNAVVPAQAHPDQGRQQSPSRAIRLDGKLGHFRFWNLDFSLRQMAPAFFKSKI